MSLSTESSMGQMALCSNDWAYPTSSFVQSFVAADTALKTLRPDLPNKDDLQTCDEGKALNLHVSGCQYYLSSYCLLPTCYLIILPVTSPYCLLPHHTACYLTILPVTSPYCLLPHHTACYLTILPVTSSYCLLPHHTACYLTILPVTSPYCLLPHHTACYLMLLHVYHPSDAAFVKTHRLNVKAILWLCLVSMVR